MRTHNVEREVPIFREPVRLSWGPIFAGIAVALGVWMLLMVLGLAIGLSAMNPADPAATRPAGIMTGIWSLIVPLIALFVGGVVAATSAKILDRMSGVVHGAVLWSVVTLASVAMLGSFAEKMAQMALGAGEEVAAATLQGGASAGQSLGINTNDLLGPLNQRLRAEGKPTVTGLQLQSATRDAVQRSLREGRLDRETLVTSLAEKTQLSRADADQLADEIGARFESSRSSITQRLETGALTAADKTGKALWWVFFGLLFGLGSAILGATIGVQRRRRRVAAVLTEPYEPAPYEPPAGVVHP